MNFTTQKNPLPVFEELFTRYPDHKHVFMSYYNLYEIYNKLKDNEKSEYYKNQIINKFPDNPRAKILANPEYVQELEKEMNRINVFYEETYLKYKASDFVSTINNANYAISQFKGDATIPKFKLLRALSIGQTQGQEKLKTELDTLIKTYPKHEVSVYAKEIIDYIYTKSPEILNADIAAEAEIYSFDALEVHYIIVSAGKKVDINQLNFNLINYNLDNYDNLNLGILKSEASNTNLLVVQSFGNLEKARRYYESLNTNGEGIIGINKPEDVTIFLISAGNYDKLLKDNSLSKYLLFNAKHY